MKAMKKIFVFVETPSCIYKHELDPTEFDGCMGNFIAKISHDYPEDSKFYVGGLA